MTCDNVNPNNSSQSLQTKWSSLDRNSAKIQTQQNSDEKSCFNQLDQTINTLGSLDPDDIHLSSSKNIWTTDEVNKIDPSSDQCENESTHCLQVNSSITIDICNSVVFHSDCDHDYKVTSV